MVGLLVRISSPPMIFPLPLATHNMVATHLGEVYAWGTSSKGCLHFEANGCLLFGCQESLTVFWSFVATGPPALAMAWQGWLFVQTGWSVPV